MLQLLRKTRVDNKRISKHPLLIYDPDALKYIQLIKIEYFENRDLKPPVPRRQEIPADAVGTLHDRAIVVATSHAWFYQCHPDPHGNKLNVLRTYFFPRLRKKYPNTDVRFCVFSSSKQHKHAHTPIQILIFDDWHSCHQYPRTDEEDKIFRKAMEHMNSLYLYCDAALFVEFPLPTVDDAVYTNQIRPSDYKWGTFREHVQVRGVPQNHRKTKTTIDMNDVVVSIGENQEKPSLETIKNRSNMITDISFHKRPFGIPNRIPPEKRGWLFAERITIAIKIVASSKDRFSDIVLSNSEKLKNEIFVWSDILRDGLKRHEHKKAMDEYMKILDTKQFSFGTDVELVRDIVKRLVEKFAEKENWKEESSRQKKLGRRARDILLKWGTFSDHYISRSGMIDVAGNMHNEEEKVDDTYAMIFRLIFIAVVPPILALSFFSIPWYSDDPLDKDPITFFWNNIRPATIMCTSLSLSLPFFLSFFRRTHIITLTHPRRYISRVYSTRHQQCFCWFELRST